MKVIRIILLSLLTLAAAAYVAYCAQLWSVQRRMMFPGAQMDAVPSHDGWPAQARSLRLGDGDNAVHAVWVPAATGAATSTLIFFHGNAEFAFESAPALARLVGPSRNLMVVEYPGYAQAPGAPTLASIRDASLVAFDWLLTQPQVDARRIVAVGRSVGGGPAAELSRHRPLAALVLVSTFAAVSDFARALYVPPLLIRDPFDNRDAVAHFPGPVLVLHGDHDDVIPYRYGVDLGRSSPRAEFVTMDCAHNDCALDGPGLVVPVTAFLDRHRL